MDGNDRDRVVVARDELHLPNAMNAAEITDKLGLHSLRQRHWYRCSSNLISVLASLCVPSSASLILNILYSLNHVCSCQSHCFIFWFGCDRLLFMLPLYYRFVQSTCATSGEGLYEGLDWLSSNIANKVCMCWPCFLRAFSCGSYLDYFFFEDNFGLVDSPCLAQNQ